MKLMIALALFVVTSPQFGFADPKQCDIAQPSPRKIVAQPQVPIASQLLPGDEMVLIERATLGVFVNRTVPEVAADLDIRAKASDVIVVAELLDSRGILTDNDSWIRTERKFRPVRVVKDTKKAISETAPVLTVYHDGGESRINGVLVKAGYYYAYEANRRYLLFLRSFSSDNNALIGVQFAIDASNKIVPMQLSDGRSRSDTSRLHGLEVDVVLEELRRRLASKG